MPVFLIIGAKDPLGFASFTEMATRAYSKDLKVVRLDTGHWIQLEAPDELNGILEGFVEEVVGK